MAVLLDWKRLLAEFGAYQMADDLAAYAAKYFEGALLAPPPQFVGVFLSLKEKGAVGRAEAVKQLYGYLLEKRYGERINLLYFAFEIFDGPTTLPDKIINMTPLPHEDGRPSYRFRFDPHFKLIVG